MQKTSAQLSPAAKNEIWINKWMILEFPSFFNTLWTFWPNSILFQGLESRIHNSILSIPRGNPAWSIRKSWRDVKRNTEEMTRWVKQNWLFRHHRTSTNDRRRKILIQIKPGKNTTSVKCKPADSNAGQIGKWRGRVLLGNCPGLSWSLASCSAGSWSEYEAPRLSPEACRPGRKARTWPVISFTGTTITSINRFSSNRRSNQH